MRGAEQSEAGRGFRQTPPCSVLRASLDMFFVGEAMYILSCTSYGDRWPIRCHERCAERKEACHQLITLNPAESNAGKCLVAIKSYFAIQQWEEKVSRNPNPHCDSPSLDVYTLSKATYLHPVGRNRTRDDPSKAARHVLVLLGRLDADNDLLDPHSNLLAARSLLELAD